MFNPHEIDYSRLDVSALLETRGIAGVDALLRGPCERWLSRHGYDLTTIDFGRPVPDVFSELGATLSWRQRFSSYLDEAGVSLNALDEFDFPVSTERGRVLMVLQPEALAASIPQWFDGFLDIASAHSLFHLACGSKFFTLLVLARDSPLPGRSYGTCQVPCAYWNMNARKQGFVE